MKLAAIYRIGLAGCALLVVTAGRPAHAETKSVKLAYESNPDTGCVTGFVVDPDEVRINSWWQKVSPRKVVWTPVPRSLGGNVTGVTWEFVEKSSDGATCTGLVSPVGNGYMCKTHLDLSRWTADWRYKVVAKKDGCEPVVVDPAIIFRGGGGNLLLLVLLFFFLGGGAVLYWRRHRSG
jgi:hypothetical protein